MNLAAIENTSGDFVVDRLEDLPVVAKGGGIVNFMLAAVNTDGTVGTVWANGEQPFQLLGANEMLRAEFMSDAVDRR